MFRQTTNLFKLIPNKIKSNINISTSSKVFFELQKRTNKSTDIHELKTAIKYLLNKNVALASNKFDKYDEWMKNFFANKAQHFINDPTKWSLFYSDYFKHTQGIDDLVLIESTLIDLKKHSHLLTLSLIHTEQQANMTKSEFYVNLAESYHGYYLKLNQNETNLSFNYMKILLDIYCNHIEHCLNTSKQSPPNHLAELDSNFKSHLNRLDYHVKTLMNRYDNFNSMPLIEKQNLFRSFSFNETKWFHSSNQLLNDDVSFFQMPISDAIKGAIRFNRMDIFHKLFNKLNDYNLRVALESVVFPNESVWKHFFNLKLNDIDQNLNDLLTAWQNCLFIPNKSIIDDLKSYINR